MTRASVAETLCADYARFKNVDARLFRIFNTYGEFMHPDDGRVISEFLRRGRGARWHGAQTRSFCYVSDLVAVFWCWRILNVNYAGP
jgi:UDP-glucuronate decarboxylase